MKQKQRTSRQRESHPYREHPGNVCGLVLTATLAFALAMGCDGSGAVLIPQTVSPVDVVVDSPLPYNPDRPNAPLCADIGEPGTNVHQALFDALNAYRIENDLAPLVYSTTLETAADAMVADLYERNFFSHTNPDGDGPGDRALDAGFCHQYVGENIAAGQDTVSQVMQAWKDSPSHNLNMLEPDYVYVGMGYYTDPTGRRYWAQEFAYDLP